MLTNWIHSKVYCKTTILSWIFLTLVSYSAESELKSGGGHDAHAGSSASQTSLASTALGIEIESVSQLVQKGLQEGDAQKIVEAHHRFTSLEFEPQNWERIGQQLKICKWSSQESWRDSVGGHLFFPTEVFAWELTDIERYHLWRRDTIMSLAFGARYKNPICMYYLAKVLDTVHTKSTDAPLAAFIGDLYETALSILKLHEGNVDACYVMGRSYSDGSGVLLSKFNPKLALLWHEKGSQNLKNRYGILHVKSIYKAVFTPPSADDFLKCAREGFPIAYFDAASLQVTFEKKVPILDEAISQRFVPAFVELGLLHEGRSRRTNNAEDLTMARNLYKRAGESGLVAGFVQWGKTFTDNITFDSSIGLRKNVQSLSSEQKTQVEIAFQKALIGHHPEGCDYLGEFVYILHQNESDAENKRRLANVLYHALEEGIKLGSVLAYEKVKRYYKDQLQALIDKYGPAPQEAAFKSLIQEILTI